MECGFDDTSPLQLRAKSKSFIARKPLNGSSSPASSGLGRANSIYRSKTPTSMSRSKYAQHDVTNGSRTGAGAGNQGLSRTGSGGRVARYSTQPVAEEKVS